MGPRTFAKHQRVTRLVSPHRDRQLQCYVTGCKDEPENSIEKNFLTAEAAIVGIVHACRAHTSRFDKLIIGPGPL